MVLVTVFINTGYSTCDLSKVFGPVGTNESNLETPLDPLCKFGVYVCPKPGHPLHLTTCIWVNPSEVNEICFGKIDFLFLIGTLNSFNIFVFGLIATNAVSLEVDTCFKSDEAEYTVTVPSSPPSM